MKTATISCGHHTKAHSKVPGLVFLLSRMCAGDGMPSTVLRYHNGYYGGWSWWYNLALDICQYLLVCLLSIIYSYIIPYTSSFISSFISPSTSHSTFQLWDLICLVRCPHSWTQHRAWSLSKCLLNNSVICLIWEWYVIVRSFLSCLLFQCDSVYSRRGGIV